MEMYRCQWKLPSLAYFVVVPDFLLRLCDWVWWGFFACIHADMIRYEFKLPGCEGVLVVICVLYCM